MVPRKTIRQKMVEKNISVHPSYHQQQMNIPRGVPVSGQYPREMQMKNLNY